MNIISFIITGLRKVINIKTEWTMKPVAAKVRNFTAL